jgi:hypothetical protein
MTHEAARKGRFAAFCARGRPLAQPSARVLAPMRDRQKLPITTIVTVLRPESPEAMKSPLRVTDLRRVGN